MGSQPKILIFHPALAPYRVDAFNLLSRRFNMRLMLFGENLQEQKFDQKVLTTQLKCQYGYLLSGFNFRKRYIRFGVIREIRRYRPDIVLTGEFSLSSIIVAIWRILTAGSFMHFIMTDDNPYLFENMGFIRRILRWMLIRSVNGFIVTSEEMRLAYGRMTPTWKQLHVGVLPIIYDERALRKDETVVFAEAARWRKENLCDGEIALFFFGRLTKVKNLSWLIACVSDQCLPANAKLYLTGSGELEDELKAQVKNLRLSDKIIFIGRKEGLALKTLMAAQDVMILPSISETFGAVVSESLQWGAPCLVSDRVGAKTLINDSNGRVFCSNDAYSFHKSLSEILQLRSHWHGFRPSLLQQNLNEAIDKLTKEISHK